MQANGVVYEDPSNGLESAKATLRDYISIMKWGITIANLMATFAGMWVASGGHPGLAPLLLTLVGTALVVAGGAALNNFYDRDIDQHMMRTKNRAVAQGKVSPGAALAIGLSMSIVGLAILLLFVNWQSAACAFVGLFVYSYLYTVWFKRHTTLNTVLGGVSGAMPPLIGWAAGSGGSISLAGWCLFFTFFLWQPPHFAVGHEEDRGLSRCRYSDAAGRSGVSRNKAADCTVHRGYGSSIADDDTTRCRRLDLFCRHGRTRNLVLVPWGKGFVYQTGTRSRLGKPCVSLLTYLFDRLVCRMCTIGLHFVK
ncbi:hypothetical protein GCM10025858_29660 [Alicyclobacillus sacchari]|nr:hypothetical protein GCM10025858_29660 [Alicyclobacillus sacchari]